MHQFMSAIGRKASIVNLDPANDNTGYPCALDIRDIITLDQVMDEEGLGPNGGVMYALEELRENIEWLEEGLSRLGNDYVLFDCPGQVELFTHHMALRRIFARLVKMGYRVRFSCFLLLHAFFFFLGKGIFFFLRGRKMRGGLPWVE
jgi:GTPase SAR1 family protein